MVINFYKKNLKFIIPISIFMMLILIVLTLSLKNNDTTKLTKLSKEIVAINESLKDTIKNDTLDYNKTCSILQNNLESFNKILSELNSVPLKKADSEESRSLLLNYTHLNVDLYTSALNILNNKESEDFSTLYKSLITNEKKILKSSTDLSNLELSISFPKSANIFFVYLNNYINTLYKSNREKDISNSQKLDFLLYLNSVVSDFSKLKEDFQIALIKIREDKRDLSILLNDINNKRSIFLDIKNKSYSISIPSGAQSYYMSLEDTINSYEVYIDSLEASVKSEIALNNEISLYRSYNSTKTLDEGYSDANDKYSNFISTFESFQNAISDYKNK